MNDKIHLKQAKDFVYLKGHYKGIMTVGEFKDEAVEQAKLKTKEMLIKQGLAVTYYEPENECMSRSQDLCVVALYSWSRIRRA